MEGQRPENDVGGHILPFVRPGAGAGPPRRTAPLPGGSPVEDVVRFESEPEQPEDYRRRQFANAAAFGAVVLLVLAGVWLAVTLADMQRNQDCVLAGRKNCAQISIVGSPGR